MSVPEAVGIDLAERFRIAVGARRGLGQAECAGLPAVEADIGVGLHLQDLAPQHGAANLRRGIVTGSDLRQTQGRARPRDEPLLAAWGHGVTYVGEGEAARLVKIAHNVFLGVVIQSLAEITVLAERGGVSRSAFLEFLNESVLGSTFSRYKSPALVNLDFHPTFTSVLLRKDLQLGLAAGKDLGVPMPLAAATDMLIAQVIGAGYTEDDFATLVLEQARRSGYQIEPENVPVDDGLAPEED